MPGSDGGLSVGIPIGRQRSAEDARSLLGIYSENSAPPGKSRHLLGRPKVRRGGWSERSQPESEKRGAGSMDRAELVARQIPGRSRPVTGGRSGRTALASTGTTEKPPLLYSRQELAERLRLAWKHREENRASIDIFLAGTVSREAETDRDSSSRRNYYPETEAAGKDADGRVDDRSSTGTENAGSLAKQKRASFQSGANKAFFLRDVKSSIDEDTEAAIAESRATDRPPVSRRKEARVPKPEQRPRRTNSAPPPRACLPKNASIGNRVQVDIVIDTSDPQKKRPEENHPVVAPRPALPDTSSKLSCNRPIRSAPVKRRARTNKKRLLAGSAGSSARNEGSPGDGKKSWNRSGNKPSVESKLIDVVTMVSLVSSADSDTDAENSPIDDKLINQLRSKLPTTSIIKTSINSTFSIVRKPIKSVSFQRESFDEDDQQTQQQQQQQQQDRTERTDTSTREEAKVSGKCRLPSSNIEEPMPWRIEMIPGLALPVHGGPIHEDTTESSATTELPLTDREKRCLAVPIGDSRDNQRKLLRARSTPSRGESEKKSISPDIKERLSMTTTTTAATTTTTSTNTSTPTTTTTTTAVVQLESERSTHQHGKIFGEDVSRKADRTPVEIKRVSSEPHFETSKEKECWHLYKKMCDKGVYVSFDTVLRGMLTPTEYRLRQQELRQQDF